MHYVKAILLSLISLCVIFCATTSSSPSESSSPKFSYKYKPPATIDQSDINECKPLAEKAASSAYVKYLDSKTSPYSISSAFGLLGAVVEVYVEGVRVSNVFNTAYEQTMKSCLLEKGYEIQDLKNNQQ